MTAVTSPHHTGAGRRPPRLVKRRPFRRAALIVGILFLGEAARYLVGAHAQKYPSSGLAPEFSHGGS